MIGEVVDAEERRQNSVIFRVFSIHLVPLVPRGATAKNGLVPRCY
jgi:hypothetical protein